MYTASSEINKWVSCWRKATQENLDSASIAPAGITPKGVIINDPPVLNQTPRSWHQIIKQTWYKLKKERRQERGEERREEGWLELRKQGMQLDLARFNRIFAIHPASEVCRVCRVAKILREEGPNSISTSSLQRLFHKVMSPDERKIIVQNHLRFTAYRFGHVNDNSEYPTKRVVLADIILERNHGWPALRMQEYRLGDDAQLKMVASPNTRKACVFLPCPGRGGGARPVRSSLRPELVLSWIQQCREKHDMCSRRRKTPYPSTLILIDTLDMRLVAVEPDARLPYLALSYVWGNKPQPVLTKAAKGQWTAERGLQGLGIPRTILDSIHLAKLIEYRYLWVDALCIVQDDNSVRHQQIAQMYDIYQHADMTIVAAGGEDCASGLHGISMEKERLESHQLYNIPGLPLAKLPSTTGPSLAASTWRTRGWTFQEELCSQRALVMLPEVVIFNCPSAIYREDLEFEIGRLEHNQASREGLTILSGALQGLKNASQEQLLGLFQDLVKQYMRRTLTRQDDIENAFAGVAGILAPFIGALYNGIPEVHFREAIHGCWFWDTSFVRRIGNFPSWSWTGWVHLPENDDLGIQAMAGHKAVLPLQFYQCLEAGIRPLGRLWTQSEVLDHGRGRPLELWEHFLADEDDVRAKWTGTMRRNENDPAHLIAFASSIATLKLVVRPGGGLEVFREYRVVHPGTGKHLTSIRLDADFVAQTGSLHSFIIIACNQAKNAFRLMLITTRDGVAERVNVTVPGRPVQVDDWMSLEPRKSTIVMG